MSVQEKELLHVATRVLVTRPTASLADVATEAGVSRTTLHSRFPTRQALLVALAHEAMDLIADAYREARLEEGEVTDALRRAVELFVPLGPRVEFLLRERSLDTEAEVTARYADLDRPLLDLVERGRREGVLRTDLPAWWLVTSLISTVYAAWEAIADGRLAPRDAPALVLTTVLEGTAA